MEKGYDIIQEVMSMKENGNVGARWKEGKRKIQGDSGGCIKS